MRKLLITILLLAPSFAFAATLTWPEYYDFIAILQNELPYITRLDNVKGNLLVAVMDKAEQRTVGAFEYYKDGTNKMILKTGLQYTQERTDLFTKVKDQFK